MLRSPFGSERIQMTDPQTGIKVIQITSYPTPSEHLLYDWPSITPDNARLVFLCQRYAGRGAPWDLFRCDTDGLGLFQLTEFDEPEKIGQPFLRPAAVLAADGEKLYLTWNATLCELDIESGGTRDVLSLERFCRGSGTFSHIRPSLTGPRLFLVQSFYAPYAVRVDLATGEAAEIELGGSLFACARTEPRLLVWRRTERPGELELWSLDEDGGDPRFVGPSVFAHVTPLGRTAKVQGCGKPPDRCIWIVEPNREPYKLVEGPYFWHSGASFDGEWIIADTNWPDNGLQLVHVSTRRFRTLCHPGASLEHPQWSHPHPALSHDGRVCVFDSDRTGISQVYVAHITDEFRESVKAGVLDNPKDKWI